MARSDDKDLYDVLGIEPTATMEEVESAYRKVMSNRQLSNETEGRLYDAHFVLSDRKRRVEYDIALYQYYEERERQQRQQQQDQNAPANDDSVTTTSNQETTVCNASDNRYCFCPMAGIVCKECGYPISQNENNSIAINLWDHESAKHKHAMMTTEKRHILIKKYKEDMDKKVKIIKRLLVLGKYEEACKTFFGWVGEKGYYVYCKICKALIKHKLKHTSSHRKFCTKETKEGITSRQWTCCNPFVIMIEQFSFHDEKYSNKYFFKRLQASLAEDATATTNDDDGDSNTSFFDDDHDNKENINHNK
jgi:hypothetical protein